MQIEFKKENMQINEMCWHQTATLLVESDVIVPDVCPDVQKVLLAEANAVLNQREQSEGKLALFGGVNVHILYLAEEGGAPRKIDTKFDFKDSVDIPADAMDIGVQVDTEHIEFTVINSRKINVKVMVSVRMRGYRQRELALLTDAPENVPLKLRKKPLSVYQIMADTCRDVMVEEMLEIPTAKPDADEIIKLSVRAMRGDCKIMSGKILLKGSLLVSTLYNPVDAECGVQHMEHEILFSEVADVPGLHDDCLCHVNYQVQNVHYSLRDDANGDPRLLSLDVTLRGEITASLVEDIFVIDDCYSTEGQAEAAYETLRLDEMLSEGMSRENIKVLLQVPEGVPAVGAVYSVDCKPRVREIKMVEGKMLVRGQLAVFALYGCADGENAVNSLVNEFELEHTVDVDDMAEGAFCECRVAEQGLSFTLNAASEIELRCTLEFYSRVLRKKDVRLVAGCDISDSTECEHHGMVIYFVQRGDSLWEIAKRYKTDEDKIARLNQLEGMLMPGQKLLIPRA